MQSSHQETAISGPINLLKHYSFESNGKSYEKVLNSWLERFPLSWVNLALIESLHQGRYKVISVEQILTLWQRRGKPSYHFNHDFERLVSNRLPQTFVPKRSPQGLSSQQSQAQGSRRSFNRFDRRNRFFPIDSDTAFQVEPSPEQSSDALNPQETHQSEKAGSISAVVPIWEELNPELSSSPRTTQPKEDEDEKPTEQVETPDKIETEAPPDPVIATNDGDIAELGIVSEHFVNEVSELKISVPDSSQSAKNFNSIHQFVPQSVTSVFHEKLTAMAQINV